MPSSSGSEKWREHQLDLRERIMANQKAELETAQSEVDALREQLREAEERALLHASDLFRMDRKLKAAKEREQGLREALELIEAAHPEDGIAFFDLVDIARDALARSGSLPDEEAG